MRFWVGFVCCCVIGFAGVTAAESLDDSSDGFNRFCYPELHKNTRRSCDCNTESSPLGVQTVKVDCSYKELKTAEFSEVLPLYVDSLDLAWNSLESVPPFSSDSLRQLNLMHNNITRIGARSFVGVPNLRELYLSWNSIQVIEAQAFAELVHLRVLDLSHNNLHTVEDKLFAPLLVLDTLSLSWNRNLNETQGIQQQDIAVLLGLNNNLRTLKLEACSLTNVVLDAKSPLTELSLRRNLLTQVPPSLPQSLEVLDISENLFETLSAEHTRRLGNLHELYFEDMPALKAVEEDAFVPMHALRTVSFQNSRSMDSFHEHAFGANVTTNTTLKTMIFRGTSVHTFNSTLLPVFRQLAVLDLNGMPLHCYCELAWLQQLPLETNGRCFKPSRLRGTRLTQTDASDFRCNRWPRWAYGLIVLGLIILCSAGVYFIVMGLRPHRGVTMRRKVGAGSPYARVTIEPNRQENLVH